MTQMQVLAAALAAALLVPGAARAQAPMTAAEFEAYVTGRTLTFGIDGAPYGVERYMPGRRVTWSFLDGECQDGIWYEEDGNICFLYEVTPDPQCWQFFRDAEGLRAVFMNEPGTTILYEAQDGPEPLICPGPEVGV